MIYSLILFFSFSGNSHQVCTAVVLLVPDSFPVPNGELLSRDGSYFIHSFTETSTVMFGELSDQVISEYIATGDPMYVVGQSYHTSVNIWV